MKVKPGRKPIGNQPLAPYCVKLTQEQVAWLRGAEAKQYFTENKLNQNSFIRKSLDEAIERLERLEMLYCEVPGEGRIVSASMFKVDGVSHQYKFSPVCGTYEIKAGDKPVSLYSPMGGATTKLICEANQSVIVTITYRGKEKWGGGGTLAATETAIKRIY